MSSRFFASIGSDSSDTGSSGSSSASESDHSPEALQEAPVSTNVLAKLAESSSDEEDVKRVVRSTEYKHNEAFNNAIKIVRITMKAKDWAKLPGDYEKLQKLVAKALKPNGGGIPPFYWKLISDLDFFIADNQDSAKQMSGPNYKGFNAIKNRVRKWVKANHHEVQEARERGQDDVEVVEEHEVKAKTPTKKPKLFGRAAFLKGAPDSDDESSDDEPVRKPTGRARFLKRAASSSSESSTTSETEHEESDESEKEEETKAPEPVKVEVDPIKMSEAAVDTKLEEVTAMRGKRSTTSAQLEKELDFLTLAAKTDVQRLKILLMQVSIQFDTQASFLTHLSLEAWQSALVHLDSIVTMMEKNPHLSTHDAVGQESGQIVVLFERFDDELTKGLQAEETRTAKYIRRLANETMLLDIAARVQSLYESWGQLPAAALIAHRRVERLYYRHMDDYNDDVDRAEELRKLAVLVYKQGDERRKSRTILCHIYHHALHGRYHSARDMLLMSHLHDTIGQTDLSTQILFNRTLVQIGLAAFSHGLFNEAHQCVSDICQSGRQRELLAQGYGMVKYGEHNAEQEKAEIRRQTPAHMHIPMDVIELVHLTSAVLLEVPSIAQHGNSRKHVVSKSLRKHLDYMERQALCGPPENAREAAMVAARMLLRGEWRDAEKSLLSQKGWVHMRNSDAVKMLVSSRIRKVALEAYLYTHASSYSSLSITNMCQMFDTERSKVYAYVSHLVFEGELKAAWDISSDSLIVETGEPTRLQSLALQYAEKAAALAESNERVAESMRGEGVRKGTRRGRRWK